MEDLTKNTTAIFLTPEECLLFVQFQKRFAFMKLMENTGAFDIRNGSLEVHFDSLGGIAKLDIHRSYRLP